MNIGKMMKDLQRMQSKLQEEIETMEVEASSGGEMVTVRMTGKKELVSLKLAPEAITPDDPDLLEDLIIADSRMEVTICETPHAIGLKHLDYYDAVFVHFKNYEDSLPSTKAMHENLAAYVKGGGGMCMSHFACGAFMEWPDFVNLSGRIWNGEGHDKRGPFTVKIVDKEHLVTRGLSDFETDDELYFCLMGDPEIHLLCEAFSQKKKADHPQAFVFLPGKGRVFLSTLGHDVKAYEANEVKQLYRQGAAWAAGL